MPTTQCYWRVFACMNAPDLATICKCDRFIRFKINGSTIRSHLTFVIMLIIRVPTWKTLETWNSINYFSRPGKCLEFVQKVAKKHEMSKFGVSRFTFQDVIYKKNHLHFCHIYVINTNCDLGPNWPGIFIYLEITWKIQIDLGFHGFYLEIIWKIRGILCHQRSGNPEW